MRLPAKSIQAVITYVPLADLVAASDPRAQRAADRWRVRWTLADQLPPLSFAEYWDRLTEALANPAAVPNLRPVPGRLRCQACGSVFDWAEMNVRAEGEPMLVCPTPTCAAWGEWSFPEDREAIPPSHG